MSIATRLNGSDITGREIKGAAFTLPLTEGEGSSFNFPVWKPSDIYEKFSIS